MYYSALFLGFLGSVHCLTMCGPLTMLFSFEGKTFRGILVSLIYQFARISTYAFLGGLVGWLMKGSIWLGVSQNISIITGVLFIMLGLFYMFLKPAGLEMSWIGKRVSSAYGAVVSNKKMGLFKYFLLGVLNGLLPCGLVYGALSGAVLSESASTGSAYMVFFGLGTIPAMLLSSLFSSFFKKYFGIFKLKYITSAFLIFSGSLLLLRGMNLGIPFVSPDFLNHQKTSYCEVKK